MPDYRLLIDDEESGTWNMSVDEALLQTASDRGQATLRFYQWSVPTLSLGYFQQHDLRREHVASANCPVVRRSSGGGAIVHDREITYSLVIPLRDRWSVKAAELYTTVHESLTDLLRTLNANGELYSGDTSSTPFLCFQRRAPGDVVVNHSKIMGSAQRRAKGALLQHGSLILGRSAAAPEILGLREIMDVPFSRAEIIRQWTVLLGRRLLADFRPDTLAPEELDRIKCLAAEKYGHPAWTQRR
jgi:lipoate-protein ligase A